MQKNYLIEEIGTKVQSPEFILNGERYTAHTSGGRIAVPLSVAHALNNQTPNNILQAPPEALCEKAGYKAIKGTWLVEKFESEILSAWKQAGGSDPIGFDTFGGEDWEKPLVWTGDVNGQKKVFFNSKGTELIARLFGGYIEDIEVDQNEDYQDSPTKKQYDSLKGEGKSNEEIIKELGLVFGMRNADNGNLGEEDNSFVPSRSRNNDGNFSSWWIDQFDLQFYETWFGDNTGLVPRVFLGQKQSQ